MQGQGPGSTQVFPLHWGVGGMRGFPAESMTPTSSPQTRSEPGQLQILWWQSFVVGEMHSALLSPFSVTGWIAAVQFCLLKLCVALGCSFYQ